MTDLWLANISQARPAQISLGILSATIAIGIFLFGVRFEYLRSIYIQRGGYLFLTIAVGVLLFKISGLPRFEHLNLEPLAHMVEEIGTMGGFIFLAWFFRRPAFPNVEMRPKLYWVLGTTYWLYPLCWLACVGLGIAAATGYLSHFSMTGLHMPLPEWSLIYRAIILVPGIIYPLCFAFAFADSVKLPGTTKTLKWRMYLAAIGATIWSIICAEELVWSAVQVYTSDAVRDALATQYVQTEAALSLTQGTVWLVCLAIPYRPSFASISLTNHRKFLVLLEQLKHQMFQARTKAPYNAHSTTARLTAVADSLGISPSEQRAIDSGLGILTVVFSSDDFDYNDLDELLALKDKLQRNPPPSLREQRFLTEDVVTKAVTPASLLSQESTYDIRGEPLWVQLMATIATDLYHQVLPTDRSFYILPKVRHCWHSNSDLQIQPET